MELGLDRLPWYGQVATFLLVAVSGVVVFQVSWVGPTQSDMMLRQQELDQKRVQIGTALREVNRLPELERELAALRETLDEVGATLPEERDAAALLRRLQIMAAQSSLSVRSFTPQAVERHDDYAGWPTRLELVGTYHTLGTFLDRVSRFGHLIEIRDLRIQAMEPPELNATIRAECVATTYVLDPIADEDGSRQPSA